MLVHIAALAPLGAWAQPRIITNDAYNNYLYKQLLIQHLIQFEFNKASFEMLIM